MHDFIVFKSVYMSNTTATFISKTFEGFYRPLPTSKHRHLLSILWLPLMACLLLAVLVRVWLIVHTNGGRQRGPFQRLNTRAGAARNFSAWRASHLLLRPAVYGEPADVFDRRHFSFDWPLRVGNPH